VASNNHDYKAIMNEQEHLKKILHEISESKINLEHVIRDLHIEVLSAIKDIDIRLDALEKKIDKI